MSTRAYRTVEDLLYGIPNLETKGWRGAVNDWVNDQVDAAAEAEKFTQEVTELLREVQEYRRTHKDQIGATRTGVYMRYDTPDRIIDATNRLKKLAKAVGMSDVSKITSDPRDPKATGVFKRGAKDGYDPEEELMKMGNVYAKGLQANKLKQFMQKNVYDELGIADAELDWSRRYLAESMETDVYGTYFNNAEYQELAQMLGQGDDLFKFIIDENIAVGHERDWWDDAATSWNMGAYGLLNMFDAIDPAGTVEYVNTPVGTHGTVTSWAWEKEGKKAKLERRRRNNQRIFELQRELTQYATNASTWAALGEMLF